MTSKTVAFFAGLAVSLLVIISFLGGALADRIFVIKPLDSIWRRGSMNLSPVGPGNVPATTPLPVEPGSVVDIADKVSESVVTVAIKRQQRTLERNLDPFSFDEDPFGFGFRFGEPEPRTTELKRDIGSGFVVDPSGLVVTNKHVVSDSTSQYLIVDRHDKEHVVSKIYRDPTNDLAILKVDGLSAPALVLGDSDQVKVGQSVIAIGTALGQFRHTVTTGVVSGLGRGIEAGNAFGGETESLENVIQTDAAINPGNSGGPLLDMAGRVIGVNTAISAQGQNIGFALPINIIKKSIENFNQTGQFDRPFLGVRYRVISEQAALANEVPQGAYVLEVVEGTAAAEAGLLPGDILTEFKGQKLKNGNLAKMINEHKIGDRAILKYWRDNEEKQVEITLKGQG